MARLAQEFVALRGRTVRSLAGGAVVQDGPANWHRGRDAPAGWLALSPDWLAFTARSENRAAARVLIPTESIAAAYPGWTRLFGVVPAVPNALVVRTHAGRVYRFSVWDRQAWAAAVRCVMG